MKVKEFGHLLRSIAGERSDRLRIRLGLSQAKYDSLVRDGLPPELDWLPAIEDVCAVTPELMGELVISALEARGLNSLAGHVLSLVEFARKHGTAKPPSQVREERDAKEAAGRWATWDRLAKLQPLVSSPGETGGSSKRANR